MDNNVVPSRRLIPGTDHGKHKYLRPMFKGTAPKMYDAHQGNLEAKPNSMAVFRSGSFYLFIKPPPVELRTETGPREDLLVPGVVVTNFTKQQRVMSFHVRLICEGRFQFPDREIEQEILLERTLVLEGDEGEEGILIEAGPQMWTFEFIFPCSGPGYQRTRYGRIAHRFEASIVGKPPPTPTSSFSRFFSSPSRSRGRSSSGNSRGPTSPPATGNSPLPSPSLKPQVDWLIGTLTASRSQYIIPLPTEDFEPLPFSGHLRNLAEGLGIVQWSLVTDQCTVGGALSLSCYLLDPSPQAVVWAVRCYVEQRIELTSPSRPGEKGVDEVETLMVWEKGGLPRPKKECKPLWVGEDGRGMIQGEMEEDFEVKEALVRLPDSDQLRPSTSPGTETPMRLTHQVVLHVFFSVMNQDGYGRPLPTPGPGTPRKAILKQDIFFVNCGCTKVNLSLPTYDESEEGHEAASRAGVWGGNCACWLDIKDLVNFGDADGEFHLEGGRAGGGEEDERGRRAKAEYSPVSEHPPTL